jgi:hypothetical protein
MSVATVADADMNHFSPVALDGRFLEGDFDIFLPLTNFFYLL